MTYKLLSDFDIKTDHLISARISDFVKINNKKENKIVDFAIPAVHGIKLKECEKKNKYFHLANKLKN